MDKGDNNFQLPSISNTSSNNNSTLPTMHSSSSPVNSLKSRDFLRKSASSVPIKSNKNLTNSSSNIPILSRTSNNNNNNMPSILPITQSSEPKVKFAIPSIISPSKNTNSNLKLLTRDEQQKLDQEHRKNMEVIQQDKNQLIISEFEHLSDLCTQEKNIIDKYINEYKNSKEIDKKQFQNELQNIIQKKIRVLGYITEETDSSKNIYSNIPIVSSTSLFSLRITQQPPEIAVANRYLLPAPQLSINPNIFPCSSTFIICVNLAYHGNTDNILDNTLDGKQKVLQGIKRITVDSSNHVIFTKLKIMEVSSKHRHQPFCLVFSLEEYKNDGQKNIISKVKSVPFHVQSRPNNKRKSTGSLGLPPAKRMFFGPSQHDLMMKGATSSLPNLPTIANEKNRNLLTNSTGTLVERGDDTCNYIDITDLLVLPQKEAARRLGISESMLCKRFKECTRRKWPYRYLRKIDKVIAMLESQINEGTEIGQENIEKLATHKREREECLKPIRIRITSYDKILGSRTLLPPPEKEPIIEDETTDVVETLQNLGNKTIIKETNTSNTKTENTNNIKESENTNTTIEEKINNTTPTNTLTPNILNTPDTPMPDIKPEEEN